MEITYYGHSCFKLKGQRGVVVTDPYSSKIGLTLPKLSSDIITLSHDHYDHAAFDQVSGTARREKPMVVQEAGEYEVGGISVFGLHSYHDDQQGALRGRNLIYTVFMDELHICHLGDLGHNLTDDQIENIGVVDVLLCPVGGEFTINPTTALKVIRSLEPGIVIPMHYRTSAHDSSFEKMATVDEFCKIYGSSPAPQEKLFIEKGKVPEETQLSILSSSSKE